MINKFCAKKNKFCQLSNLKSFSQLITLFAGRSFLNSALFNALFFIKVLINFVPYGYCNAYFSTKALKNTMPLAGRQLQRNYGLFTAFIPYN